MNVLPCRFAFALALALSFIVWALATCGRTTMQRCLGGPLGSLGERVKATAPPFRFVHRTQHQLKAARFSLACTGRVHEILDKVQVILPLAAGFRLYRARAAPKCNGAGPWAWPWPQRRQHAVNEGLCSKEFRQKLLATERLLEHSEHNHTAAGRVDRRCDLCQHCQPAQEPPGPPTSKTYLM